MNRNPSSVLPALLCGATLLAPLTAQQPSLDFAPDENTGLLRFDLDDPTSPGEGTKRAMIVCYVDIVGDTGGLSVLLKKSLGAVSSYESPPTSAANPFVVPGAEIATNGVPDDEVYTVPPAVIALALDEIEWAELPGYAKTFDAPMQWDATGMDGSKALPWGSFTAGTSTTLFEPEGLIRACLARQIAYTSGLSVEDPTVLSQVDGVVEVCTIDAQTFAVNAVLVELQNGDTGDEPTPLRIRLSRKKRVTLQLPGAGGTSSRFYHFNYIFPCHTGSTLDVPLAGAPEVGTYQLFLPTASGHVAVAASLHSEVPLGETDAIYWLRATVPAGIVTEQFAAWNVTTSQYLLLEGRDGPTLSNYVFHAPHPVWYVPFPLPAL